MTNNKQQTAVDILCGKLAMKLGIPQAITFYIDHAEEIAEAKAMHKEEIIDAHERGQSDEKDYWNIGDKVGVRFMVKSNEYYKEKFNQ
jgi:hypothetical protein